jgi:hypothetical protein
MAAEDQAAHTGRDLASMAEAPARAQRGKRT